MSRIAVLAAVAALVAAAPAAAHTTVTKRTPRPGATLERGPKRVSATFNQQIRSGASIKVTRDGATVMRGGNASGDVAKIVAKRSERLGKGIYKVSWSIKAIDGHGQSGSWSFRVV